MISILDFSIVPMIASTLCFDYLFEWGYSIKTNTEEFQAIYGYFSNVNFQRWGTLLSDIKCDGLLWATINADIGRVNEYFF